LPVTLTDRSGQQVTVASVERIVSLNADVTEMVYALGLADRLVGVSDGASQFPAEATQLPKVSTGHTLNAEGILGLRPTVVVGNETAGPAAVLEQLRGAGVPVVIAPNPPSLEAPAVKLRLLGKALGVAERGEAAATEYERDVATAAARLRGLGDAQRPRVLFLYVRGASGTQLAAGKETSIDPIIGAAGGINAGAEAGIEGYKPFTPEAAVTARPDALLVLTEGLKSVGGVDGLLQLAGLRETPAGLQRRVLDMDDLYLLGMGPRTGKPVLELQGALHPSLPMLAGHTT
jgi:iron complex transport system substrate-binding protein